LVRLVSYDQAEGGYFPGRLIKKARSQLDGRGNLGKTWTEKVRSSTKTELNVNLKNCGGGGGGLRSTTHTQSYPKDAGSIVSVGTSRGGFN